MKTGLLVLTATLLSLQSHAQGGWTRIADTLNPVVSFRPLGAYDGAAWVDIDNDGDIDLFAAPDNLFRNDGNGVFTRLATAIGGASSLQKVSGSTWADFDNDGDIDCFLSRNPSRLYRNDGSGNFTVDTSVFSTVANYPSWGGAWGEVNNDGRLDLVLAHPRGFLGPPYPCFYFKQTASGRLNEVKGYFFTDSLRPYTVPYWSDYDLDGDMDLFIASGPGGTAGPDFLYKNLLKETGIDTLLPITNAQFAADLHDGQCYNFIDYDNDGDLDLCHTSWLGGVTVLYNNNNGIYTPVLTAFSATKSSLSNAWGDFDNDGDLDVIIGNDQYYAPGFYRNDGNGVFTSLSNAITAKKGATGVALGDYDNDGDLDVFMMAADTTKAKGLFRNDSLALGNHWVSIQCAGTLTNRSAIGTKVRVKATINGVPTWQIREILAQNTFQGQHDLRAHFGLGNATRIDSVIVDFLGGHTNAFANVQPDMFYRITEDGGLTTAVQHIQASLNIPFKVYPNPAGRSVNVVVEGGLQGMAAIRITDASGKVLKTVQMSINGTKPIEVITDQLPAGSYWLTVRLNGASGTKRFVKLR